MKRSFAAPWTPPVLMAACSEIFIGKWGMVIPDGSSFSAAAAATGSLFCLCRSQVQCQFAAYDVCKDSLSCIPHELVNAPLDAVLGS